uniref:Uncharacterized protein n=1 Tax=Avena sativa TaxID=4498 RepID=A0ACD5V194_AVESA
MEVNTNRMISLNGTNYQAWKIKMKDLLYVMDYWKLVFSTKMPSDMQEDQWEVLHLQACGFIRQWVDDNALNHIIDESHACILWKKLEELYACKEGTNKMFLTKKLMRLRYKEGTPIADHVNEFQGIINQLSSMGITFDEVRALLLLGSLPDTWETFKVTVCNSAPNGVATWNLVKTKVLNEESRKIADKDDSSSHYEMLVTESRGRSKGKGPSKRGELSRSKSKGKYKYDGIICHHCYEKGHIKWHCEQWKKDKKKKKKVQEQTDSDSDSEGGRIAAVEDIKFLMHEEHDGSSASTTEERITVVSDDTISFADSDEMTWIPDTGATIHAISRRDLFTNYTAGDFGVVKMGNNDRAKIIARGDVHLETENDTTIVLKSVRHVEAFRLNILSVGLFDGD